MRNTINILRTSYWFIPAFFILVFAPIKLFSQPILPVPDHIVILVLENHAYEQIIGSSAAPYINALAADPYTALFTSSYAVEHPSQPNYLDLYSGCNQGVTSDSFPTDSPFTTANLGRQLIDAGRTFITYSEGLPSVGYNGISSNEYVRKHNPAANWMGTDTNQIPSTTNQSYSAFPSTDFFILPTISLVIPTQNNDMHNGSDPYRITNADNWVYYNLDSYIQWAKTHNSLFILTFDEDNGHYGNHITTIFNGQMVKNGQYPDSINHFTILRTIEDMYGLPYACNASSAIPIIDCWSSISGIRETISDSQYFSIFPNPAEGEVTLQIENSKFNSTAIFEITDIVGHHILSGSLGDAYSKKIELGNTCPGIYFVKVSDGIRSSVKMLFVAAGANSCSGR